MIKKFTFLYIFLDLFLILISLYFGGYWLINTQVAFICSMLITFASFYSYKKVVNEKFEYFKDEKFDEDIQDKEIVKNVRKLANTLRVSLSFFRILSYLLLVIAFLFLNHHEVLEIAPFLLGLAIIPLSSMIGGFWVLKKG